YNQTGVTTVRISHGISSILTKKPSFQAFIYHDNWSLENGTGSINEINFSPNLGSAAGHITIDANDNSKFQLSVYPDSFFDQSGFSSTSINRGYIRVFYED
ncbi:MAG TPA: hypothetical protein DEG69_10885, partial [Flavobacteriaceae bacterium]|nr:hypothetical protein [Flavobacteriaceae bacterium]